MKFAWAIAYFLVTSATTLNEWTWKNGTTCKCASDKHLTRIWHIITILDFSKY